MSHSPSTETHTQADAKDGVVERLLAEELVPASKLAREIGRDVATVTRWSFTGVLAPPVGGIRARIPLEHVRFGGRLYTSRQAFARFVAALTRAGDTTPTPATPAASHRTTAERRRAAEAAARESTRLGC